MFRLGCARPAGITTSNRPSKRRSPTSSKTTSRWGRYSPSPRRPTAMLRIRFRFGADGFDLSHQQVIGHFFHHKIRDVARGNEDGVESDLGIVRGGIGRELDR